MRVLTLFTGILTLFPTVSQAQSLVVDGFDANRTTCAGSPIVGNGYSTVRNLLTSEGHSMGPGWTRLEPASFDGVDIMFLGSTFNHDPLDDVEMCMLEAFVDHGGALLEARHFTGSPSIYGTELDYISAGVPYATFPNAADPDVAAMLAGVSPDIVLGAHNLLSGPGEVFMYNPVHNGSSGVMFREDGTREGRAILIGDQEVFKGVNGGCSGLPHISKPQNQVFFMNVIDWLGESPGLSVAGEEAIEACANPDDDGDGVLDVDDLCLNTPAGAQVDPDGCALEDLCPCDDDWKNHGEYVSCITAAVQDFVSLGLLGVSEQGAIISDAGQSDCGMPASSANGKGPQ